MAKQSADAPTPIRTSLGSRLAVFGFSIMMGNVLLIGIDVAMRGLFRAPQSWVSDIAELTYPVAIAACFPAALEAGHMIVIRFLGERLGIRPAFYLDLMGQILMALLLAVFTWQMFARAASDWAAGFKTTAIALLVAPTWLVVAVLLLAATVLQFTLTFQMISKGRLHHA